jgi:hypothetical protein
MKLMTRNTLSRFFTLVIGVMSIVELDLWRGGNILKFIIKPKVGRIAIKVINHLNDEVLQVFRVR